MGWRVLMNHNAYAAERACEDPALHQRNILRIARAVAAASANIGHALVEGGKSAVLSITTLRATGAPRIVLGIGVHADPCDTKESRGHEEESLHGEPFRLGC
jgi:hypothetical protein